MNYVLCITNLYWILILFLSSSTSNIIECMFPCRARFWVQYSLLLQNEILWNKIWPSHPAARFILCCRKTSTIFGQTQDKILDILIQFFSFQKSDFSFFNRMRVWVSSQSGTCNKTRPDKTVQIIKKHFQF